MIHKFFALFLVGVFELVFSLSLLKWREMDPNLKPQTLVESFDHANPQFYPSVYVALRALLGLIVCHHAQGVERSNFSSAKRLKTPLRSSMTWDDRLSCFAILHIHKRKGVNGYWWCSTEFASPKGTPLPHRLLSF